MIVHNNIVYAKPDVWAKLIPMLRPPSNDPRMSHGIPMTGPGVMAPDRSANVAIGGLDPFWIRQLQQLYQNYFTANAA